MKDVSLFLLKKVFKSRLNWIILALFVSGLGVTFYFNSQTANSVRELETSLAKDERVINEYEEKLSQISDTSSEEYQIAKNNLELQKNHLTQKTEILTLLKEGRWKEAYYLQWQDEEKSYEIVSKQPTSSSDLKMAVDRERKTYQALYPLNIKAHNLVYPTHGIDQIVWILELIIPSLFVVAIIFMLTQLFAERYQNHLDTAHLYPFSKVKFAISSLGVGVGYVSVLFIGISGFSFLVGSLTSGFGQLDYPYPIYSLVNQEVTIGKIQVVISFLSLYRHCGSSVLDCLLFQAKNACPFSFTHWDCWLIVWHPNNPASPKDCTSDSLYLLAFSGDFIWKIT